MIFFFLEWLLFLKIPKNRDSPIVPVCLWCSSQCPSLIGWPEMPMDKLSGSDFTSFCPFCLSPSPVSSVPIGSSRGKKLPLPYLRRRLMSYLVCFQGSLFIRGTVSTAYTLKRPESINTTSYKVHNDRDCSRFLPWPSIRQLCCHTIQ